MSASADNLHWSIETSGVLVTPEAVVIDLDTGGIASRLLAGIVDVIIRLLIVFVLVIVGLSVQIGDGSAKIVAVFSVFFVLLVYPVACETIWRGRTIGKRMVGLRVVTVDGAPIGFREAWLRTLGSIADLLLPPGGMTGLLFIWGTPRNQRIGDLLAGTIVVRDMKVDGRGGAFWFAPPHGFDGYAETIDPTAMTVDQYTLVRSFLLRVHELNDNARYAVAHQLSDALSARLHHVRPPSIAPETFLLCAVSRYQRQHLPLRLAQGMAGPQPGTPTGPPPGRR